jgi:hypothetical protein
MIKRLLQGVILVAVLLISTAVFAAPDVMDANTQGTTTGLIYLTSPSEENVSVSENIYVLGGRGQQGAVVTLYLYDNEEEMYKKVIVVEEDGNKPVEWEIGASGVFIQETELLRGKNELALRADFGDDYQVVKIIITVQDLSILRNGRLDLIRLIFGR